MPDSVTVIPTAILRNLVNAADAARPFLDPAPVEPTPPPATWYKPTPGYAFAPLTTYALPATLRPTHGTIVGTTAPGVATLELSDKGKDGVLVSRGVVKAEVRDLSVRVPDKEKSAVVINGIGCIVDNVSVTGPGAAIQFDGAEDLTVDRLYCTTGDAAKHGLYAGTGGIGTNKRCWFKRVDMRASKGTHAARVHDYDNLRIGDPKLSLDTGPGAGFACYFEQLQLPSASDPDGYKGSAFTLKDGKYATFERVLFVGGVSFECLPANVGKPGWEAMRVHNPVMLKCELHVQDDMFVLGGGVVDARINDTKIESKGTAACIDVRMPAGAAGTWPAATAKFERCAFTGGKLGTAAAVQAFKEGRITFAACTFNGKLISASGDVA